MKVGRYCCNKSWVHFRDQVDKWWQLCICNVQPTSRSPNSEQTKKTKDKLRENNTSAVWSSSAVYVHCLVITSGLSLWEKHSLTSSGACTSKQGARINNPGARGQFCTIVRTAKNRGYVDKDWNKTRWWHNDRAQTDNCGPELKRWRSIFAAFAAFSRSHFIFVWFEAIQRGRRTFRGRL